MYVQVVDRPESDAVNSTLTKGTPVMSLDTGVTLGKIESVYLDCDARRLVAFSFSSGGGLLAAKRAHIVEIDDIHAIGPDAVTLDDARAVHDLVLMDDKLQNLVELDQMVKRSVMTDAGANLGRILGLDFDPETFRLQCIRVEDKGRGGEQTVDGHDIVSIGEEVIVVAGPATASASQASRQTMPSLTPLDRSRHAGDLQHAD
jgi:sporulation protein YlmC with PRC-barrel domain